MAENDWYVDPSGRHEMRWWANGAWSASVSDQGVVSADPLAELYPDPGAAPTTTDAGFGNGGSAAPFGDGGFTALQPAFAATPAQQAPAWPAAPLQVAGAKIPAAERLRTGVPGPVAWAAVFLSTPGLALTLYGLAALFLAGQIDDFNNDFGDSSELGNDASNSVAGVGVFLLAVGGFYLATAVGLMMLVPWSRITGIIIGALHALISLVVLSQSAEGGVVFLLMAGAQIWLLFAPTTQQAFNTRSVRLAEVAQPSRL